jgi:quercetin dioxygenase-like cupin family protein
MENIAAPGTATPMHFHAEDEIFHILEGTVTFSIDGDVFNASVGSIVVIPAGAQHAWRNRSNSPIRMLIFFSPGGVEELPQACRLVSGRAIYCSRTIRIRHCWAAHR